MVDPTPLDAIRKLASREDVDEVIASTLPRRLSRWMAMDLRHRSSGHLRPRHPRLGPGGPLALTTAARVS